MRSRFAYLKAKVCLVEKTDKENEWKRGFMLVNSLDERVVRRTPPVTLPRR